MSLYHEAAQILNTASEHGGSLKSIVFGKKDWKSEPKTLFALSTEAAKWSGILSEVIERSGLLHAERQLTPTLAMLLSYDLLLSKNGVALPRTHGLHATVLRRKSRLNAELTKTRLARGSASLDALRDYINDTAESTSNGDDHDSSAYRQPRWVRINTILTSSDDQLQSTFRDYMRTGSLEAIARSQSGEKLLYIDDNISGLIAVHPRTDIIGSKAYKEGKLILQDKASCFPAYLLDPGSLEGDVIDACAAPGNKTTHLAALLASSTSEGLKVSSSERKVLACEKDRLRSATLEKMVKLAGASDLIRIKANQDFLKLNPSAKEFENVSGLLLDPSCSGSGIVGRDEISVKIHLPRLEQPDASASKGKKRKRAAGAAVPTTVLGNGADGVAAEESAVDPALPDTKLQARLEALSSFQLRLLEHAMAFPAAKRITYSTCSVHDQENEHVVEKALASEIAVARGWRIMKKEEQVNGLKKWHVRGSVNAIESVTLDSNAQKTLDIKTVADGCIRCEKRTADGTMGFFLAGFVRESASNGDLDYTARDQNNEENDSDGQDEDEWNGFGDDET